MLGRYAFILPDLVARGELRPLRAPQNTDDKGRTAFSVVLLPDPLLAEAVRQRNGPLAAGSSARHPGWIMDWSDSVVAMRPRSARTRVGVRFRKNRVMIPHTGEASLRTFEGWGEGVTSKTDEKPDFEREKWEADIRLRERETAVNESEQKVRHREVEARVEELKRSRWANPLVMALLAAALAALGNAGVALINGIEQRSSG
jgi:hypothetical protein